MTYELLPALSGKGNPCLNCPPIKDALDMDRTIAVGFGQACVLRDDEIVYDENQADANNDEYWEVRHAEAAAAQDPDHDWRIVLHGPMHGETYQRQGAGRWVLVESNDGFA